MVRVFVLFCFFLLSSCATIMAEDKEGLVIDGDMAAHVTYYPPPKKPDTRFYRHEIGCQMGLLSSVDRNRVREMGDYLEQNLGYLQDIQCNYLGPASLGVHYSYYINRKWAVGFSYAYAWGFEPYSLLSGNETGNNIVNECHVVVHSHLFMPTVKYQWWEAENSAIYSKAALGVQHRNVYCSFSDNVSNAMVPKDNRWLLAYQLSVLGWEFGKKKIRCYFELGYGNEGIFNFGVKTRL